MFHLTLYGLGFFVVHKVPSGAFIDISSANPCARDQGHKDEGDIPILRDVSLYACIQSEQPVASRGFQISHFWGS